MVFMLERWLPYIVYFGCFGCDGSYDAQADNIFVGNKWVSDIIKLAF